MQQAEMQQKTVRAATEGGRQPISLKFHFKMNNFDNFLEGREKEPFIAESAGHFKPFFFFFPLSFFLFPYGTSCFCLVCIWPFELVLLLALGEGLAVCAFQSRAAQWICR